jgi:hypothetical protein
MELVSLLGQLFVRLQFRKKSEVMSQYAFILSRVGVTKTRVWIGESVYWIFTSRNYK